MTIIILKSGAPGSRVHYVFIIIISAFKTFPLIKLPPLTYHLPVFLFLGSFPPILFKFLVYIPFSILFFHLISLPSFSSVPFFPLSSFLFFIFRLVIFLFSYFLEVFSQFISSLDIIFLYSLPFPFFPFLLSPFLPSLLIPLLPLFPSEHLIREWPGELMWAGEDQFKKHYVNQGRLGERDGRALAASLPPFPSRPGAILS